MAGMDPKMMAGMDPKMMAGMDPKMLASMGLDAKMLASMGLDPKGAPDPKLLAGIDPKLLGGLDPKMLAGMDPKMLQSMGIDPKMLASMSDPKMMASMGMDPKMMASMGMDPKTLANMGMDPKTMASMGMDPKAMASMGMDPKMLSMMGMDPKMLAGMDPKMLASIGMDPKMLSDPNLMAMYSMGMMPPSSAAPITNGVGSSSGTPLPSSKGNSAKPKPGTVAAALQEKKDSEKARSEHSGEKGDNLDDSDIGEGSEDDFRRGLTSEERVLLREKKKERLMKENESDHMDEGLNLSVSRPNGGSEHTTKLEALLAKPIDDLPSHLPHSMSVASNGEVMPRTEGVCGGGSEAISACCL